MVTNHIKNLPSIAGEFVVLVETLRLAQVAYEEAAKNVVSMNGSVYRRKLLIEQRRLERLVDSKVAAFMADVKKLDQYTGRMKGSSELPGVYNVERETKTETGGA
jgi:hypothetical protein